MNKVFLVLTSLVFSVALHADEGKSSYAQQAAQPAQAGSIHSLMKVIDTQGQPMLSALVKNADVLVSLLQGWVDNIANLSYRSADKITVRIPGNDAKVIEYDLGFMSGDVFKPLETVSGRYSSVPTAFPDASFATMVQVLGQNYLAKNKQATESIAWLTGGKLKPSYLFLIKYFLLLKDFNTTHDVPFFAEETGRLLFRLLLSGDINLSAVSLEQAMPKECALLLRTLSVEAYDFLELLFAELTGTKPQLAWMTTQADTMYTAFVFNNQDVVQAIEKELGSDEFSAVQQKSSVQMLELLKNSDFQLVPYQEFLTLTAAQGETNLMDPRNKLVARLDFNNESNLHVLDGKAYILCLADVKAIELSPLMALQQIIVAHIKAFQAYVAHRQDVIAHNPVYSAQVANEVERELKDRHAINQFLSTENGKAAEQRLEAQLASIIAQSHQEPMNKQSFECIYSSPEQIEQVRNDRAVMQFNYEQAEIALDKLELKLRYEQNNLIALQEANKGYMAWFYPQDTTELESRLDSLTHQIAEKQVEFAEAGNKVQELDALLISLRKQQEASVNAVQKVASRKEKLFDALCLRLNSLDLSQQVEAQRTLEILQQEIQNDVDAGSNEALSVAEIVALREAIAQVYEYEGNNSLRYLCYSNGVTSEPIDNEQVYRNSLGKVARIIREQNSKLLRLGSYFEQLRYGTMNEKTMTREILNQLMLDREEVGYLLKAANYSSVLAQARETLTQRPEISRFFKDMRTQEFAPVYQDLINAVKNIVANCSALNENTIALRYLTQLYAPYLAPVFETSTVA